VAQPGGIIQLSWSAPADSGSSAISTYEITSTPAGFSATEATTSRATTALSLGTSYTFSVKAVNSSGTGPAGTSNAAIAGDIPSAVTNLNATAPSGRAVATWTAASPNGHAISSYTIVASPGGKTLQVAGDQTTGTLIGLAKGTLYTLTVSAANDLGSGPGATSDGITANCSDTTHTINAVDSASVEYGSLVQTFPEPSIYGYRGDNSDLRGWAKFALSLVPTWAQFTSMTLYMKVGSSGGSPTPVLEIWYSQSDGWSRNMNGGAGPQPVDISPTLLVSAQSGPGVNGSYQGFSILVGARDWSGDIADGFITLGVRNEAVLASNTNSTAQYYSSDSVATGPYIVAGACE
jgi:hypothetical protein